MTVEYLNSKSFIVFQEDCDLIFLCVVFQNRHHVLEIKIRNIDSELRILWTLFVLSLSESLVTWGFWETIQVYGKAKAARSFPFCIELLPTAELFAIIRRSIWDDWCLQNSSSFSNSMSQYLQIQSNPTNTPWYNHFEDIRTALIVRLSRLCSGHNRLPPHMKKIKLSETDLYPFHANDPSIAT